MNTKLTCRFILSLLVLFNSTFSFSKSLEGQRLRLYTKGTVQAEDGKVYNIWIIPGTKKINTFSIQRYKDSAHYAKQSLKAKVYVEEVPESFMSGFDFATSRSSIAESATEAFLNGLTFAVEDVVLNFLIKGIGSDFENAAQETSEIWQERSIGWPAMMLWSWFKPIGSSIVRVVASAFGFSGGVLWSGIGGSVAVSAQLIKTGFGVTYMVVGPTYDILKNPIASLVNLTIGGMIIPATAHVWNGVAWSVAQTGNVPSKEGFGVILVPDPDQSSDKKVFEVGLSSLVDSIILQFESKLEVEENELNKDVLIATRNSQTEMASLLILKEIDLIMSEENNVNLLLMDEKIESLIENVSKIYNLKLENHEVVDMKVEILRNLKASN